MPEGRTSGYEMHTDGCSSHVRLFGGDRAAKAGCLQLAVQKVLSKSDAEILDEWDDLSLFGQGYEVGFRAAELMDMKRRKGLK